MGVGAGAGEGSLSNRSKRVLDRVVFQARDCIMGSPLVRPRAETLVTMPALDNKTALILDDNPLVLKLARALLEREGATVVTAASWIEFNHVLVANDPDVILLDVNLPSIKGNRLAEVLKSQSANRNIPIILISDLPERSLEEILPASGADAWMRKPLTREKLLESILSLLPKQ